ncbi:NAD(P)/FAD-dependent oxidoreductase [Aureibacter tunicatorum]|uniref:D-amino-acid dehydrogenase n=1 Tax=Aureibacter tunicatorum TaxID=866807 RepID=A0AAE4BS04_9BACT|nr:FAD-dependent oxidoreductase [Aureibacter tunicatorum]MDR6237822.1 D-amino-acid dehydrogenase [Aureibacter tunicatorum]BDD02858.1 amino acid dehydrogenase [Aureibacter tunicatorum]
MSNKKDVLVIGGGIVGICSAYYLWKDGHQVTLLDKGEVGDACSRGNAGLVVPSHFVPLAAPGMIKKGIKWMFNPESPFHIKPSLDPKLISWLWQFYRHTTNEHVENTKIILRDLNMMSRSLFKEFFESSEIDFNFEDKGLLMLYKTDKERKGEEAVAKMAHQIGIEANILSAEEAQALQPGLEIKTIGGVHYPKDAHLNPTEFINKLKDYLVQNGVQVHENTEVTRVRTQGGKVTHAYAGEKEFTADDFVIATGAYTSSLAKDLGVNLPVVSGKGYSITLNNPKHQMTVPSILCEAKIAVTPMADKLRFAGTMEITGQDLSVNQKRFGGLLKAIPDFLPQYPVEETRNNDVWSGLRPCSPDGLPFIGRFGKLKNLIAATGHSMMGVSLGPVTGKLVSEIVNEQQTSLSLTQITPDRYN